MGKLIAIFILFSLMISANQGKLFIKLKDAKNIDNVFNDYLLNGVKNKKDIQFIIKKASKASNNMSYLHFAYTYKGILVENQTIVISQKNNKPYFLFGNFNIPKINNLLGKHSAINSSVINSLTI